MNSLAHHMRITGLQISNEDVDSRSAAVSSLRASWAKGKSVAAIFEKVGEVAIALSGDGTPTETLGAEVEKAVQKKASAFLYADRPLDVGIVAGMAAVEIMASEPDGSGWLISDIWAAALWSALGFQAPLADEKRERLRVSVLDAAREHSIASADVARKRVEVPDFGAVSLAAGEEAELTGAIKKATEPTISALRRNAALDREELDFLWWAQLRRSRLLKRPLDSISEITRVVAAGVEGAAYLRRFPSEVHREIVVRIVDTNSRVPLGAVLESLANDREVLASQYAEHLPTNGAILLPLLTAIVTGETDGGPAAAIERDAEEWGSRALLEAALLRMRTSGPGKL